MSERKVKVADDKCWVTVSTTVNIGNYESTRIEAGFSKTYGKNAPIKLIDKMEDELEALLEAKAKRIKRNLKRKRK